MPWTAHDAQGHTKKANTPAKAHKWAKAANSVLRTCLAAGTDRNECEGRAERIANAQM